MLFYIFDTTRAIEYKASNNATAFWPLLRSPPRRVLNTRSPTTVGTPGGTIFDDKLGVDYSKRVLADASAFVWTTFQQSSEADRKNVQLITLSIENLNRDDVVALTSNNMIQYNAKFIADGNVDDLNRGFEGVLYHEVTHVWQWNGNNAAPGWLIEGIADFVRLKAGYVPSHWAKPGDGNSWTEGYSVTARFLDYCNGLKGGFVTQLNAKMRDGYSDDFFVELLGKPVDQLWNDYKAQYGS
ncbi:uncharacterized protein LOC103714804 [Phoenix dactylifera]|uniref:Uncharacterized protein LOC103714804 n=1 Tax=Phoenix dactylifera TaxID=42345 RepID=A0A8B7CJA1_PHODC|nr:uncharacterized protein LOC103714804 [Phoenix dactylifera]